jgi:tetratricopeptide (TPR) repeat protein
VLGIYILRLIPFLVLWCAGASLAQEGQTSAQNIRLEIRFGKAKYLVREPVILHGSLTNYADTAISFWGDDLTSLTICDTTGKPYPKKIFTHGWSPEPTHRLEPGQTYEFDGDILFEYTINEGFPVGTYQCVMVLPEYLEEGKTSDTAQFRVEDPTGLEKEAQRLFIEAQRHSWGQRDCNSAFRAYQQLIETFPTSVYVPGSLYDAALCYKYSPLREEKEKSIKIYLRLIEEYPDYISLTRYFGAIGIIYGNLKDKAGALKTMEDLIDRHPDTKISEKAQYWLEKIEKWEFE